MDEPQVQHKAPKPPGNIPQKRVKYIYVGSSVFIVLVVLLSNYGATSKRPEASTKNPRAVQTSSREQIEQGTAPLREEIERLRTTREQAQNAAASFQMQQANPGMQGGIPGQAVVGPDGRPYYAGHYQQAQEPQRDPIEEERKKREYASLFASSIALSYRVKPEENAPKQATSTTTETSTKQAESEPKAEENAEASEAVEGGHKLFAGRIIESVLTNRLEGSFTGPVNCMVTTNVYSHDLQHLLIPKGTRVLGEAKQVTDRNQKRLAVMFHRLIMPDGYSVNLDQTLGLDQAGAAALKDKVNRNYLSTFGTSIMLGLISGFSLRGTGGYLDASGVDMYRQGVSQQLGRDSTRILDRNLNRMPSITIREGARVVLMLSADLSVPAYDEHPPVPGL